MKNLLSFLRGVTLFNFRAKPAYADGVGDVFEVLEQFSGVIGIARDIYKKFRETSFEELNNKADNNDKEAQYLLGLLYYFGARYDGDKFERALTSMLASSGSYVTEIKKNPDKAMSLFRQSAAQEYAPAKFMVANMYCSNAYGTYSQAVPLYKEAYDGGVYYAAYNLGVIYRYGMGDVPENPTEALGYFKKAAKKHNIPEAYYELGGMYHKGEGVNKDENSAVQSWKNAANRGYAPAKYKVAKKLQNKEEAKDLYLEAAAPSQAYPNGYAPAQVALGILYKRSENKEEKDKARDFFSKAAEQDNAYALWLLGDYYRKEGNEKEALNKYKQAAKLGSAVSQYRLALIWDKKNKASDAWDLCRKAADQGLPDAQRQLAGWYERGYGVKEQDYVKAYTYYCLSYKCGDKEDKETAVKKMEKLREEIESSFWNLWGYAGEVKKAKVSKAQVEEAEKEAEKLYNAIQERIKYEKRQSVSLLDVDEKELDALNKQDEEENKSPRWLRKVRKHKKFFAVKFLQLIGALVGLGIVIYMLIK